MLINSIPIIDYQELKNLKKQYVLLGIHINFNMIQSKNVIQELLKIDFPFFLSIDFSSVNSNNIKTELNNLIALTFNTSYLKESKNPLLIFCGNEPIKTELKSLIKSAFKNQGYNELNTHQIFKGTDNLKIDSETLFITNKNIGNRVNELYNSISHESINRKLFIITQTIEIDHLIKKIEECETQFAKSNEKLYLSYKKIQELDNKNNRLKSSNKALNTQVLNSIS